MSLDGKESLGGAMLIRYTGSENIEHALKMMRRASARAVVNCLNLFIRFRCSLLGPPVAQLKLLMVWSSSRAT
jgi:hypothetical protein